MAMTPQEAEKALTGGVRADRETLVDARLVESDRLRAEALRVGAQLDALEVAARAVLVAEAKDPTLGKEGQTRLLGIVQVSEKFAKERKAKAGGAG